jgi:hypothetical protein
MTKTSTFKCWFEDQVQIYNSFFKILGILRVPDLFIFQGWEWNPGPYASALSLSYIPTHWFFFLKNPYIHLLPTHRPKSCLCHYPIISHSISAAKCMSIHTEYMKDYEQSKSVQVRLYNQSRTASKCKNYGFQKHH